MDRVEFILKDKGRQIFTIPVTATVLEAIREMNRNRVGGLVVMDGERIVHLLSWHR